MPLIIPKTPPQMIVIFPDDDLAFDAYRFLQSNGISPENMVLVGEGFSSPEYLSCLMPPRRIAIQTAKRGLVFGLQIGGLIAGIVVGIGFFTTLIPLPLSVMLGGILIVTSLATGTISGWLYGIFHHSNLSIKCRDYLRQGQYLLLLEGSESIVRRGREILHSYGNRLDF